MKTKGTGRQFIGGTERCFLLLALIVAAQFTAAGQNMELSGGTMTVASGTRISITGPVVWTVAPAAQLVNDGRILLGEQASIVESDASPITGFGTEEATVAQSGPLVNFEAGGLGLGISAAGLDNTTLVRGHVPLDNNGTDQSIARWYRLEPVPAQENELELVLRYASSELNGHNGNTLQLYIGDGPSGPWSPMPGTANGSARTVSATWSGPWASTITAFPQGISTDVPDYPSASGFEHWPNPTADLLWVRSKDGTAITTLELLDLSGRSVIQRIDNSSAEQSSLSLRNLPSGIYLLRVNGSQFARVVKQ